MQRRELNCETDDDCPSDSECRAAVARCIATSAEDAPPTFTLDRLAPLIAGVGTTVELEVTASESLHEPPVARLKTGGETEPTFELVTTDEETGALSFRFTPSSDHPPGNWPVVVSGTLLKDPPSTW